MLMILETDGFFFEGGEEEEKLGFQSTLILWWSLCQAT